MPLYTLQCPDCLEISEHFMGLDDNSLIVKCPECGHGLTRQFHRHYMSDLPRIQGDTVSGGCNYSGYYDEGLDCWIKSKAHRQAEMAKQGVVEYSPDPKYKKFRDEQSYIRKHAKPDDAQAVRAINEQKKAAATTRRKEAVDKAFDNAPLPKLPEL